MKKTLILILAALMAFSCIAHADSILDADPEEIMTFDRESPVTDWEGEWVLAAAYIGEDFADENDIDVTGLIAVPENAVKMTVTAVMDLSATGSPEGVMVDMAAYIHCHVYDMEATLKFDESITDDEPYLRVPWDGWLYTVRGEQDGDFNMGVGKFSTVLNVTVPAVKTGLASAMMLTFVISWSMYLITTVGAPKGFETMATVLLPQLSFGYATDSFVAITAFIFLIPALISVLISTGVAASDRSNSKGGRR